MGGRSFGQYRAIDIGIWTVVVAGTEYLTATAAAKWFPGELYTLSQTLIVVCLVMMRWGGWAAIHAVAGGLAFCAASGATLPQYAVYCVGNCFALCALSLLQRFGKEAVRLKPQLTLLFVLAAFAGAQLGRWLVGTLFGAGPSSVIDFFATDSLTLVYTAVVVLIARKADGVFEDQRSYLIRTESERKRRETLE